MGEDLVTMNGACLQPTLHLELLLPWSISTLGLGTCLVHQWTTMPSGPRIV